MNDSRVETRNRLDQDELAAVLSVVEAATETDGVRPLNEQAMLRLRHGDDRVRALLLREPGGAPAGFAHVDFSDAAEGPSGELVVHPAHRRRGHGRALVRAALAESGGRLRLWAHGGLPAAERLAASAGFEKVRTLLRLRRPLAEPLPAAVVPSGVRIETFRPGVDERAWLDVNARAFAHHPEQGGWTMDDLLLREREPWFDPAGFFLARRGDRLAGFHWTKVHPADGTGGEPVGEVYVVGVDPAEQGTGLGRALTLTGLAHLRARGLPSVMLYVDGGNAPAIRLYESLGFTLWDSDVMYEAGPGTTPRSSG
jgi:mycothiol synthase